LARNRSLREAQRKLQDQHQLHQLAKPLPVDQRQDDFESDTTHTSDARVLVGVPGIIGEVDNNAGLAAYSEPSAAGKEAWSLAPSAATLSSTTSDPAAKGNEAGLASYNPHTAAEGAWSFAPAAATLPSTTAASAEGNEAGLAACNPHTAAEGAWSFAPAAATLPSTTAASSAEGNGAGLAAHKPRTAAEGAWSFAPATANLSSITVASAAEGKCDKDTAALPETVADSSRITLTDAPCNLDQPNTPAVHSMPQQLHASSWRFIDYGCADPFAGSRCYSVSSVPCRSDEYPLCSDMNRHNNSFKSCMSTSSDRSSMLQLQRSMSDLATQVAALATLQAEKDAQSMALREETGVNTAKKAVVQQVDLVPEIANNPLPINNDAYEDLPVGGAAHLFCLDTAFNFGFQISSRENKGLRWGHMLTTFRETSSSALDLTSAMIDDMCVFLLCKGGEQGSTMEDEASIGDVQKFYVSGGINRPIEMGGGTKWNSPAF